MLIRVLALTAHVHCCLHANIAVLRQKLEKVVPFNKVQLARLTSFGSCFVRDSRHGCIQTQHLPGLGNLQMRVWPSLNSPTTSPGLYKDVNAAARLPFHEQSCAGRVCERELEALKGFHNWFRQMTEKALTNTTCRRDNPRPVPSRRVNALQPRCRKTPFAAEPMAVDVGGNSTLSLWWADCQGSDGIISTQYNFRRAQICSILLILEKRNRLLRPHTASPVRGMFVRPSPVAITLPPLTRTSFTTRRESSRPNNPNAADTSSIRPSSSDGHVRSRVPLTLGSRGFPEVPLTLGRGVSLML